jgi:hypothetical protein
MCLFLNINTDQLVTLGFKIHNPNPKIVIFIGFTVKVLQEPARGVVQLPNFEVFYENFLCKELKRHFPYCLFCFL